MSSSLSNQISKTLASDTYGVILREEVELSYSNTAEATLENVRKVLGAVGQFQIEQIELKVRSVKYEKYKSSEEKNYYTRTLNGYNSAIDTMAKAFSETGISATGYVGLPKAAEIEFKEY